MQTDSSNTLLNAALGYLRLGLSVIPISGSGNGKQAAIRWKQYQTQLPTEQEVREWFTRNGLSGVAIIFGPVSGHVYARDFDAEAAYHAWAAKHPDLAAKLPTVKTARGFHVYFRHKTPLSTKKKDFGELRCQGDLHPLAGQNPG